MRYHIVMGMFAALGAASVSVASAAQCSIHPTKGASNAQLASLATVSKADAQQRALARIKSPATVASAELEAEKGCLIWSFDLKIAGESGVQEVQIDAGNGSVLSVKHESAVHEAAEAVTEAVEGQLPKKAEPPQK